MSWNKSFQIYTQDLRLQRNKVLLHNYALLKLSIDWLIVVNVMGGSFSAIFVTRSKYTNDKSVNKLAFGWTNECKFCIVTAKKGRLDLLQVVFYFSVIFQTRSTHCCPLLLGKLCIWFVSVQLFQRCCIAKRIKYVFFCTHGFPSGGRGNF